MGWLDFLSVSAGAKGAGMSDGGNSHSYKYPPEDPGIRLITPEQMLTDQRELLSKVALAIGLPEKNYAQLFHPMFFRLAAFMHLLPASREHHHARPGGLFRHSLEVGLYTLRGTENVILTTMMLGTPLERRNQTIRWRGAALMAGLLHDIAKVYTDVMVTAANGAVWQPEHGGLYEWARNVGADRYYIEHRQGRHGQHDALQGAFVDMIVTHDFAKWLDEFGGDIYLQFRMCVCGGLSNHKLPEIVTRADQRSVEKDLRTQKGLTGSGGGVSQAQQVVDVMRRLLREGAWQVNGRGGRVWIIKDGGDKFAHVAWYKGYEELFKLVSRERAMWVPREPSSMAELLIEREVAEPFVEDDGQSFYWPITGGVLGDNTLYTLRLPAEVLFPDFVPEHSKCHVRGFPEIAPTELNGYGNGRTTELRGTDGNLQGARRDVEVASGAGVQAPRPLEAKVDDRTQAVSRDRSGTESDGVDGPGEETAKSDVAKLAEVEHTGQDSEAGGERRVKFGTAGTKDEGISNPEDKRRPSVPCIDKPAGGDANPMAGDTGQGKGPAGGRAGEADHAVNKQEAREWLEQHAKGPPGMLMSWFTAITEGDKSNLSQLHNRRFEVTWPASAEGIGLPKDILVALEQMGALDTSSGGGSKVVRKDNGLVVIIKPNVTKRLMALKGTYSAPGKTAEPRDAAAISNPDTGVAEQEGERTAVRAPKPRDDTPFDPQADGAHDHGRGKGMGQATKDAKNGMGETRQEGLGSVGDVESEFRRAFLEAAPKIGTLSDDGKCYLITRHELLEWNDQQAHAYSQYRLMKIMSTIPGVAATKDGLTVTIELLGG